MASIIFAAVDVPGDALKNEMMLQSLLLITSVPNSNLLPTQIRSYSLVGMTRYFRQVELFRILRSYMT